VFPKEDWACRGGVRDFALGGLDVKRGLLSDSSCETALRSDVDDNTRCRLGARSLSDLLPVLLLSIK
jgi:hypothetical protein